MATNNREAVLTALRCSLEGGHRAQVTQHEILTEFQVSKDEALKLLQEASATMGECRCIMDYVISHNADGVREFRRVSEADVETWKTGAHVEAFGIRKLSLSIQDAASLQWEAELEGCWEEYQRRLPEDLPQQPGAAQVVDLSDEDCCVLDSQ